MDADVLFLEDFLKKQNWRSKKQEEETNESVNDKATEALKFLKDRSQFWEQTRKSVMKTK